MSLKELLLEKKSVILKTWFAAILETYPPDTANFLKNQKNQFANPIGHTITDGLACLFHELLHGMDAEKVTPFLDNIVRIRAVQDFTPSQAVALIFLLKNVIREGLGSEIRENNLCEELLEFESNIDALALFSFDIYMKCREKIYELKANDLKNWTYRIVEKANQSPETQDEGSGNGSN